VGSSEVKTTCITFDGVRPEYQGGHSIKPSFHSPCGKERRTEKGIEKGKRWKTEDNAAQKVESEPFFVVAKARENF